MQRNRVLLSSSGFSQSCRPDVLSKMPRSCNIVFDMLRSMIDSKGQSYASVRYLAQVTHLGTTAVWRALHRLRGAHLIAIASDSRGARGTVWQLRWKSPLASFPQVTVPLAPIRSNTRDSKAFSPKGTVSPSNPNSPSKRALAWAMAQLRKELTTGYDMTNERRQNLCTGIGASVWRAMKRGEVRAGPSLAVFVREVVFRLREAKGVQESQRAWCSWGGWAVRTVIDNQRAKQASDEASARLIARIKREKEEAKGGFDEFLAEVGASSLREYIRQCCAASSEAT